MTDSEAGRLKEDDRVEYRGRGGWKPGRVVWVRVSRWADGDLVYVMVGVRAEGRDRRGRRYPEVARTAQYVRVGPDPVRAHVYADYLSEAGEERAADLLRKRFPLDGDLT